MKAIPEISLIFADTFGVNSFVKGFPIFKLSMACASTCKMFPFNPLVSKPKSTNACSKLVSGMLKAVPLQSAL
jgi:hypothetical protein